MLLTAHLTTMLCGGCLAGVSVTSAGAVMITYCCDMPRNLVGIDTMSDPACGSARCSAYLL